MKDYTEYMVEQAQKLLAIDSPSGYTKEAAEYLCSVYREMGYEPQVTVKGGVLVKLCEGSAETGKHASDPSCGPILLMAHTDTLGAMVSGITPEGKLKLTPLGGLNPNNTEAENCRIITRGGKIYTGTFQLINASIHVNGEYNEKKRSYDSMEVLLSWFVYGKIESVLYAGITIMVYTRVADLVLYRKGNGKVVFLISKKGHEIARRIILECHRGVTILNGRGAYTGMPNDVLVIAIRSRDYFKLKTVATEVDDRAFIIASDCGEIHGNGFRPGDLPEVAADDWSGGATAEPSATAQQA